MYRKPNESAVATRVTGTGVTTITSSNAAILGILSTPQATAATAQLWQGTATSAPGSVSPIMSFPTGVGATFLRVPAYCSGGVTVNVGPADTPDLTLFWAPTGSQTSGSTDVTNPIPALAPVAWYRYGRGIVLGGSGVRRWKDQSGNGRDLLQNIDTNRPVAQSDGSILFDGVDNFIKSEAFTLIQPTTVYALVKQVTWANGDTLFDGDTTQSGRIYQDTATPDLGGTSNGANFFARNSNLTLGNYGVISVVWNGAASILQVNNTTPITSNAGAGSMGGFTVGSIGAGTSLWANIQVKEAVIFSSAHNATTRALVIDYLTNKVGL